MNRLTTEVFADVKWNRFINWMFQTLRPDRVSTLWHPHLFIKQCHGLAWRTTDWPVVARLMEKGKAWYEIMWYDMKKAMRFYTVPFSHLWILLGLCRKALPSWVSKADSFLGSNLSSTFQKANLRSSLSWTSPTSRFCRPFTGRIKRIDLAGQQALASSRTNDSVIANARLTHE